MNGAIVKRMVVCAAAVLALLGSATAIAQTEPEAGRHYRELDTAPASPATGRIQVIEFFYYGCPICYEAQPHIARWLIKAGPDVSLQRVPAVSTEGWERFARSFYTLEAMGHLARLHWPLYDNHHFDGRQLNEEDNVVKWVSSNGVDGARFRELWNSEAIQAKVTAARALLDTYEVRGVPTFVIDGRFATSARMAGGVKEMMRVVEFLVQRARTKRPN